MALRIGATELQEKKTEQSYIVGLYCCVLSYYFELLNNDARLADTHLENALRLLRRWYSSAAAWPPTTLNETRRAEFY